MDEIKHRKAHKDSLFWLDTRENLAEKGEKAEMLEETDNLMLYF